MLSQMKYKAARCLRSVLLATIVAPAFAFAQQGGGSTGGGDAVVCPGKVTFYDVHEAIEINKIKLDFGPSGTYLQKIDYLLAQMARLNPSRARVYGQQAREFVQDAKWVSGNLFDVPDTGIGYVPPGCSLQQLAIQSFDTQKAYGKRYLVNQDLWNRMDASNQAALIIHELIYRELGAKGSTLDLRRFHAMLWSGALRTMTLKQYVEETKKIQLYRINDQNGFLCASTWAAPYPIFYDENRIESCYVPGNSYQGGNDRELEIVRTGFLYGGAVAYRVTSGLHYSKDEMPSEYPVAGADAYNFLIQRYAPVAPTKTIHLVGVGFDLNIDLKVIADTVASGKEVAINYNVTKQNDWSNPALGINGPEGVPLASFSFVYDDEPRVSAQCHKISLSDWGGHPERPTLRCSGKVVIERSPQYRVERKGFYGEWYSTRGTGKPALDYKIEESLMKDGDHVVIEEPGLGTVDMTVGREDTAKLGRGLSIKVFSPSKPTLLPVYFCGYGDYDGLICDIDKIAGYPTKYSKWRKDQNGLLCRTVEGTRFDNPKKTVRAKQCQILATSETKLIYRGGGNRFVIPPKDIPKR